MPAVSEPEPATIRQRYRAQVRREVKQAALDQLAQAGPGGVSISAIGKQLGVSGPALYRYFASRDDLLTELVIDAYHDLADALAAPSSAPSSAPSNAAGNAPSSAAGNMPGNAHGDAPSNGRSNGASDAPRRDPRARLEDLARGYRSWALDQPHRYRLLFGPPLPGYDAHAQRLVGAAEEAMNQLLAVLGDLEDGATALPPPAEPRAGQLPSAQPTPAEPRPVQPPSAQPPPAEPLASPLTAWAQRHAPGASPATALRAVLIWSRLHGIVSLEIAGNFESMGIDPGQLFESQLATLAA